MNNPLTQLEASSRNGAPKIWVVTEYSTSSQNSTGYFWEKAIETMRSDGLEVRVIAPNITKQTKKTGSYARYSNPYTRAVKKFLLAVHLSVSTIVRAKPNDIVLCGTNPELLLLLLALLNKMGRFKLYTLVHDVFPENLIPAKVLKPKSVVFRVLNTIFRWTYSQPEKMFVIGRDMETLVRQNKGRTKPTFFISNWVDHEDVQPTPRENSKILDDLGWGGKVVFQFFGNIGRLQGVDNMLKAIDLVKSPEAAFLFVGEGVGTDKVRSYIKKHPKKDVKHFGEFAQVERSAVLAACDVAVISLAEGMWGLGVPSKAYFSMASDRPILAVVDKESEIDRMVLEEDIGWSSRPGDPQNLANLIDSICITDLAMYHGRVRNVLLTSYSKDASLKKFSQCMKN